jgi:hypothetical protein
MYRICRFSALALLAAFTAAAPAMAHVPSVKSARTTARKWVLHSQPSAKSFSYGSSRAVGAHSRRLTVSFIYDSDSGQLVHASACTDDIRVTHTKVVHLYSASPKCADYQLASRRSPALSPVPAPPSWRSWPVAARRQW